MTTIPATTASTLPTSASAGAAATGSSTNPMQSLSGNFDMFLQLLTTQLQNQDPTSPMDTNQFTQQLVEYSQVEQQISTNSNLQQLISLYQNNSNNNAVSYLGKTVTLTNGNGALSGGTGTWNYTLASPAAATTITVTNAAGKVVYTGSGQTAAGNNQFTWNGQDNGGNQLPDGTYTVSVSATDASGKAVTSAVAWSGKVTQVDFTGSTPMLMIGSMEFPLSSVSAVAG